MHPSAVGTSPSRPRFSWPVRLLIGVLLFDIVFHSFTNLASYRDWMDETEMAVYPARLPTRDEIAESSATNPPGERAWRALDSTWEFFKPWPDRKTRDKLDGWGDGSLFMVCWLSSRLGFVENLLGIQQRWTMFSPNVAKSTSLARFRLAFADGTCQVVRLTADPEDLTRYSHWFEEKVLDTELRVVSDYDSRLGFCNYLAHKYPLNENGFALEKIYIYRIEYRYPAPDEDVLEVLSAQNGPPNWDRDGPRWQYEVATKELRKLSEQEKLQARDQLRQSPAADH